MAKKDKVSKLIKFPIDLAKEVQTRAESQNRTFTGQLLFDLKQYYSQGF